MAPVRRFLSWWLEELRDIFFPRSTRRQETGNERFVAAVDSSGVRWLSEKADVTQELERRADGIEPSEALRARILQLVNNTNRPIIGLRLRKSACLERRVVLPTSAHDRFASILALDIERTTPFKLNEIYTAYIADDQPSAPQGQIVLRHFVVKRDFIDMPRTALAAVGLEPSFADCWDEEGEKPIRLNFLATPANTGASDRRHSRLTPVAAAAILLLVLSAGTIYFSKLDTARTRLQAEVDRARVRHQNLRLAITQREAELDAANAIQNFTKHRVQPELILEELTHVLPDDTYLTDLELSGGKLTLGGLSTNAALLLQPLERSPYFEAVEMASPSTLDHSMNKEQFRISARLTAFFADDIRHKVQD